MKRNKVLFGLFAGVLALIGGTTSAQNKFYELGPSNVGGQVSSLVADKQDTVYSTIYAGATSGGLFLKSDNRETLQNFYASRGMDTSMAANLNMWHYVPYTVNGKEDVLPISAMIQGPDNTVFIGTGDMNYAYGRADKRMSTLGKGIYRFDPSEFTYKLIPGTRPSSLEDRFSAVYAIDYVYRDGKLYLYVASNAGLFRWQVSDGNESDWSRSPETIFDGPVQSLVVASQIKTAYFASGSNLYMIPDATAQNVQNINITSTCSAFGQPNSMLKIAVASSNPSYLYAMVVTGGVMQNIYLTRNMQNWTELATATVRPFTYTDGFSCGAITVDPAQPEHVILGGTSIYSGTGYVEGNRYQWMKTSQSEFDLNGGNYMQQVFTSSQFVHSGIHTMLPVYRPDQSQPGTKKLTYYIATNGGVYSTDDLYIYENINDGLNNLQINSIAVTADGSVISGANDNACPFIESRSAHDSATSTISWYDDGSIPGLNHSAIVLWKGTGGKVSASSLQQISPEKRRNIYVSDDAGDHGRAYRNYFNYADNQVWTINEAFTTSEPRGGGTEVGNIYTWETLNNTIFNDSVQVIFDTLGYVMRPKTDGSGYDSIRISGENFMFKAGDKLTVLSRGNSEYPFEYTFTQNHSVKKSLTVKNPIQARGIVIGTDGQTPTIHGVYYSWRVADFTKVNTGDDLYETHNLWARIFYTNAMLESEKNIRPYMATMSEDGRFVYIAVHNLVNDNTMLVRVKGFENVDFSLTAKKILGQLTDNRNNDESKMQYDTLHMANGSVWIPRHLSSMTVDGNSLILTFDGYDYSATAYSNIARVSNIDGVMSINEIASNNKTLPAFCAMVEDSTHNIYMGTTEGVSILNPATNQWSDYANISGIAVTSIVQQKANLQVRRHLGHNGIEEQRYLFAKTKWPRAIYFGTYGRGIFMDMTYVTDTVNEISDPDDYNHVGIPTVANIGNSSVSVYPNPVSGNAHISLNAAMAGKAQLRIYDLNGRLVLDRNLGHVAEGEQTFTVNTDRMNRGMYLVNVIIGGHTSATKMMVR